MIAGAIEKVSIYAYTDRKLEKKNSAVPHPFFLPVNPENYSKTLKVETDNRRALGKEGTDPGYSSTAPEELKLEFIFDGTGTIENYKYTEEEAKSVKDQMKLFLKVVYDLDGTIHRPNFLKVVWGQELIFPCVLSNLDIQYTLFEASGDPARAKVTATFLRYKGDEEEAALTRKGSPDLTHVRRAIASDRLDLMTYDIYNDTKHLLQVARLNKLSTIRHLPSGTELRFPPLEKPGTTPPSA